MRDAKIKIMQRIYGLLAALLLAFGAYACGSQEQLGGIVGEVKFNTQACVAQQKIINIRNDDTQNPQRVMGVYFELGTNEKSYFKIEKVVVGGTEYAPSSNLAQDVLIPAGGIMSVYTTYNPREITTARGQDTSYLDLFLNGPKLGILQIKTSGEATTAQEGCGAGETKTFTVKKANLQIKMSGSDLDGFNRDLTSTGDFKILIDGEKASIDAQGFPVVTVPLPSPVQGLSEITIGLDSDTFEGTFVGGKLEFEDLTLKLASALPVEGVKLSSDSLSLSGANALTLTGSNYASGKMTVVVGTVVAGVNDALNGAAVGLTLELEEQN